MELGHQPPPSPLLLRRSTSSLSPPSTSPRPPPSASTPATTLTFLPPHIAQPTLARPPVHPPSTIQPQPTPLLLLLLLQLRRSPPPPTTLFLSFFFSDLETPPLHLLSPSSPSTPGRLTALSPPPILSNHHQPPPPSDSASPSPSHELRRTPPQQHLRPLSRSLSTFISMSIQFGSDHLLSLPSFPVLSSPAPRYSQRLLPLPSLTPSPSTCSSHSSILPGVLLSLPSSSCQICDDRSICRHFLLSLP